VDVCRIPDSARVDHSLACTELDPVLLAVSLLNEGLVTGQGNDQLVAGRIWVTVIAAPNWRFWAPCSRPGVAAVQSVTGLENACTR
jgi:hypothetical protein